MIDEDKIIELLRSNDDIPFSVLDVLYNSRFRMNMKKEDYDRLKRYYDKLGEYFD